ncbi:PadR family transcriptional regulator [Plantactinospora siamensis]|uniref:PadR family transcriptional regulator n=1 Tax=Plantactinospora siamensis TaxID=555372 RepID=A0ABV6NWK6_9ACTN
MRSNPHRPLTPLALAVLELLHERAMHPYEMHQTIRDRQTDRVIKVRAGSLYHTVERLHRDELIEPVRTGRAGRRPERTEYALTDAGREEFHATVRALVRHPEPEYPLFGVAVQMLHTLGPDEVVGLLDKRAMILEPGIAARQQVLDALRAQDTPRVYLIEVEYALTLARAELAWIRQLIDDVRTGALAWAPKHHGPRTGPDQDGAWCAPDNDDKETPT